MYAMLPLLYWNFGAAAEIVAGPASLFAHAPAGFDAAEIAALPLVCGEEKESGTRDYSIHIPGERHKSDERSTEILVRRALNRAVRKFSTDTGQINSIKSFVACIPRGVSLRCFTSLRLVALSIFTRGTRYLNPCPAPSPAGPRCA